MKKILLLSFITCVFISLNAQQRPYPQNVKYPYGYKSSKITTAGATSEYQSWLAAYYVECSDGARINYDGNTVSEGMGYGLVITAYAGDRTRFDKLLSYYNNRRNGSGVMHWQYPGCSNSPSGTGAATDGDMDAAMGMLVAVHQWPGQNYEQHFESLATSMKNSEFTNCNGMIVQKPGDAWGGCDCTNPSYYSPGYYRAFAKYYEEKGDNTNANWWNKAADDCYDILFANQHSSSGLVSAWTNTSGAVGPCGGQVTGGAGPGDYQYDACRTPWRIATDYLWWGSSDAKRFLEPMVNFVKNDIGGIEEVLDGYAINGTLLNKSAGNWHTVPFVGSFALAGMATSQSDADNFMEHFETIKGDNYFNTCLSVMYRFLATGNYWNPYNVVPPERCSQVDLGNEKTLCGSGSVELNAGVPSKQNVTFTWYRNDSQIKSGSENTFTATQDGTYKVVLDSANVCQTESTVQLTASLPTVDLGDDVYMASSTTLDAGVEGSGLNYTWHKDGAVISGANQKTLTVTEVGTYSVEVSATGCASQTDEVVVDKMPYISQTTSNITIDGNAESAYVKYRELSKTLSGTPSADNVSASWSALWDNSNLYVFVKVTDNVISTDPGRSWYENDGVEVFVDGDNSKNGSYDGNNDFQWGFVPNSSTVNAGGNNPGNSTAGITFTIVETTDGYNLEVAIPWSTIKVSPAIGNSIAIDIAINDNDGSSRDNKISWNASEDNGWQNPSLFGSVALAEEEKQVVITKTQTIQLQQGWNMISFWVEPENTAIDNVFSSLGSNLECVKTETTLYMPNLDSRFNSLSNISIGKGYLVKVKNQATLNIEGVPVADFQLSLENGWNLVGYPLENGNSISNVINSVNWAIESVKNFKGTYQGTGNLQDMTPGDAYYIKVNQSVNIEF